MSTLKEIREAHFKQAKLLNRDPSTVYNNLRETHNRCNALLFMVDILESQLEGLRATRDHLQVDVEALKKQLEAVRKLQSFRPDDFHRHRLDEVVLLSDIKAAIGEKDDG